MHTANSAGTICRFLGCRRVSIAERKLLHFPLMERSTSAMVKERVSKTPAYSFLRPKDFVGSPHAVEIALGRMAASGDLLPVRKGIYWKAPKTRLGMPAPTPFEIALEVAGHGTGPAGIEAARSLGLTTQVPSVIEVAVPGRVPAPVDGVRFRSRPYSRHQHGLRPGEVALLEVLTGFPDSVESSWGEVVVRVKELVDAGQLREAVVSRAVQDEKRPRLRERWSEVLGTMAGE
jgi:hypothetical protein